MCLVFPRPLGPEELPEALGQALCPSGPPPLSGPPRPQRPLSLGGGAPEAVGKGGLVVGGSCGVPGAGTGLVFTGPLGPGESPEAPGQASCPWGPPLPPGPPQPSRPSPPPSGGPLHTLGSPSTLCFAPLSRILFFGATFTPPGGPSAHWTGPSNLQDAPLPSSSLLFPGATSAL